MPTSAKSWLPTQTWRALLLLWIAGLVATLFIPPSATAAPGDNGKIVFASSRDGNFEIYVMNADGSQQTRLTNNAATDRMPVWSTNGKQIVFISDRDGNHEIYVMNEDGSGQTRLTNNQATDQAPSLSTNGKQRLYFAETFSGAMTVGGRRFDVVIEGDLVLDGYDIFADVGANKAVMKSFLIDSNSNLDIDFGHDTENPAIKAIEVLG